MRNSLFHKISIEIRIIIVPSFHPSEHPLKTENSREDEENRVEKNNNDEGHNLAPFPDFILDCFSN